jgi:hypothetical protein
MLNLLRNYKDLIPFGRNDHDHVDEMKWSSRLCVHAANMLVRAAEIIDILLHRSP